MPQRATVSQARNIARLEQSLVEPNVPNDAVYRATARDPPDAGANELDGRHQRIGWKQGPEHVEAELGSGL